MRTLAILIIVSLSSASSFAEEAPRVVRKIAPDRFQPNPRGDSRNAVVTGGITQPTKEHPLGSCDKSSRNWTFCLRSTADLSDALVGQTEEKVLLAVRNKRGLNSLTMQGFEKNLREADVKWRALREIECGNLAVQEFEGSNSAFEARMMCQMGRNTARVDELLDRYKARPPEPAEQKAPQ
jgi:uncharacterized protein YecT (DUF1311 family)